jgi:hypothetical protein
MHEEILRIDGGIEDASYYLECVERDCKHLLPCDESEWKEMAELRDQAAELRGAIDAMRATPWLREMVDEANRVLDECADLADAASY